MKKNETNGISALKLALIITGSIVAAAGIVLIIAKLLKKKKEADGYCCDCGCDEEWFDGDEDFLGELRCDDDCCCDSDDDIAAAVDEAIEAIEEVME